VSDEPLITSGDVAQRLGVTTRTIGRWVADGLITPAVTTPRGRYRFRWSEVQRELRKQRRRDDA